MVDSPWSLADLRAGPVLGIDTAWGPPSVALAPAPDEPPLVRAAPSGTTASAAVHDLLAEVFAATLVSAPDIVAVLAVRGPGSFTGLRVGLAAAAGLAAVVGARVGGLLTTAVVAWRAARDRPAAVLVGSGQGRLHAAVHGPAAAGCELIEGPCDLGLEAAVRWLAATGLPAFAHGDLPDVDRLLEAGCQVLEGPLAGAVVELARAAPVAIGPAAPAYGRPPAIRPPHVVTAAGGDGPGPTIRSGGAADVEAAMGVLARAMPDSWSRPMVEASVAAGAGLLLAGSTEPGAPPQGMALFRAAGGDAEILLLAVVPEARRLGVARRLLRATMERAAAAGCERVFLEVREQNLAALGLYATAGFHVLHRRPAYYPDGSAALVLGRPVPGARRPT